MKRIILSIFFYLLTALFLGSSVVQAVPLSLDQNIKAIQAKQEASGAEFFFVVIGDNRDGAQVYNRLVNRAKAFNPLFILNTGDFIREGQAFEYDSYIKQIAPVDIPILHLPGNHDVRYGSEIYRQYVGDLNWFFDLGDFRFIGLDNATGKFTEETVAFARKKLTSQKICLVAFHRPPAIGRWTVHAMIDDQKGGRGAEVMALIQEAKVHMVFLGHIHLYDEMLISGTHYIISAGGGAKLYDKYNFGKPEYGFVLVRVRPTRITHQWVPLD
ncbi:MAG: metallophosphoesterase [Deltaproteobacteria bacterium]|nr:metallophosphoesterase [Deltaproteobacteria bacterium]